MKIIDRLPIPDADVLAYVGAESVRLKANQIIVWISLAVESAANWSPTTPRFPAILDTGHTHNLAIQHQHLTRWAGLHPDRMRRLGHVRHLGKKRDLYAANAWLHCNQPGTTGISSEEPLFLKLLYGIAVHPDDEKFPRLPILGLRAILSNNLHLAIDGQHATVTLRTPDWRTRLLTWWA